LLFINQKKIQKALSKHKVYIPLEDPEEPEDTTKNEAFQTTMVFEHEGRTVDALKLPTHPDQKNLYVTKLIDIYYKAEDFINIDVNNVTNNDGYQFIKEAVRSVFRLSDEKLNIEWPKLHEVFLQKRRNIMRLRNKTTPARGRTTTPLETNITSPTTAL
ncbi:unnamed protein product, partial [Didymodactylos carnosus]